MASEIADVTTRSLRSHVTNPTRSPRLMHPGTSTVPLTARLCHAFLARKWRGSYRLTSLAARRLPSLWRVPVALPGVAPVYVDLRMPGMIGLFALSPYRTLPWEAAQEALLRRLVLPGDVVFDVGANIGLHSVLLASLVGDGGAVHAFEANSELYPTLRATFEQLRNGTLHECGLSDRDGVMQLFVPENREMASLAPWIKAASTARSCELRSVDSLLANGALPMPDLIKADIEGAELLMLRGAQKVFDSETPPIVLAEANRIASAACGYSSNAIPRFFTEQTRSRYIIFVEETPDRWVRCLTFPDPLHQYILAVPAARLARWPELASAQAITIQDGIPVLTATQPMR